MTAVRAEAITFAGPPHNTAAVVSLGPLEDTVVPVTLKIAGEPAVFRSYIRPFGPDKSEIRLRLPRETPPGTYHGVATLGGKPRPIVVEVEPVVRIRVQPKQTSLSVDAGSKKDFGITIVNGGNVPFDVPKVAAFDLDDAEGQDRALGRALRATLPQGERRVDRFFEEIRAAHGGEARVAVRSGVGRLEPGASAELSCLLEVPATVQAGRSYLGAWPLGNASHVIVVLVTKGATPNGGRKSA
jgi:hypothetical protein